MSKTPFSKRALTGKDANRARQDDHASHDHRDNRAKRDNHGQHAGHGEGTGRPERRTGGERAEDRSDRRDRSGRADRTDRTDRAGRSSRSESTDRSDHKERSRRSDRPAPQKDSVASERSKGADRSGQSQRADRSDHPDRSERSDRSGRTDRTNRSGRPENPRSQSSERGGQGTSTSKRGERSPRSTDAGRSGRGERPASPAVSTGGRGEARGASRPGFRPENRADNRSENRFENRPERPDQKRSAEQALCKPLFVPLDAFSRRGLEVLPQALDQVMPLSRAHATALPDAIRDLSQLLTQERSGLGRSYWSAPRFVSAYMRYFLPWNLVRLARLLPNLDLPSPDAEASHPPVMVDLGSGPLTLPLALWLSRPDWRRVPLTVVCVDTVPRPMELGRALLEAVAAQLGEPLHWRIRLVRAPLMRAFREVRQQPLLVTAGNVLNEVRDTTTSLSERMAELAFTLQRSLHPQGRALFVEPGTRLGGTLTATLRDAAMEEGFLPLAPCPHTHACPLLGRRDRGWCHATQDAGGPVWLASLARKAHLAKDSLSLSFMLLQPDALDGEEPEATIHPASATFAEDKGHRQVERSVARVLSDAFPVPGMGFARYACAQDGLVIVPHAGSLPSGALIACQQPDIPRTDARSGAVQRLWCPVNTSLSK